MVDPILPNDAKVRQTRFRIIMSISTVIAVGCVFGYLTYAAQGVSQLERRIAAGDFPNVRLETTPASVAADGKVLGLKGERYVASLKLVPPGDYKAILVANDGNPKHIEKGEIVIAAQDTQGKWHPETAPTLLERLRSPRPGVAK
jgi:hypothetical protein